MRDDPQHSPGGAEDEEIKRCIQHGDYCLAADRLIQTYGRQIKNFCGTYLTDTTLGEEVAQDVFFAAWQAMPKFRGDSSVRTWLFGIARNRCHSALKQRARRRFLSWVWRMDVEVSAHRTSCAASAEDDPPHEKCVQYALRRLSVHYRTLLHWRYVKDLSIKEAAEQFGRSETTIKRWSQQAHNIFRDNYERCMSRETSGI